MRHFLIGLVLTLVTAASLIVIIERFSGRSVAQGGDTKLLARLTAIEASIGDPSIAESPDGRPALRSLTDRIARMEETMLDEKMRDKAVTQRLRQLKQMMSSAGARTNPVAGGGQSSIPGPPGTLSEIVSLIEEAEGMILDSEKALRRDLRNIYENLISRMDRIAASGQGMSSGGEPLDPKAAKGALREKLKTLGVTVVDDEFVEIEGSILEPTRAMELIAVAEGGRAHEAMMILNLPRPSALKLALEDIGMVETNMNNAAQFAKDAKGVYIYVDWEGLDKPMRLEDLMVSRETGKTMTHTPFMFTASSLFTDTRTWERHLAADVYRNIISLSFVYADSAILACPLEEANNESVWFPKADASPPPGTTVKIKFLKTPNAEWDKR